MASPAQRDGNYRVPAMLSYGFRPFFLFSALWAAFSLCVWIALFAGQVAVPSHFSPVDWHVHEMLYGYIPAVIAGFLLTAVPNWTGRRPVTGYALLALVLLWTLGRAAVFLSDALAPVITAAIDGLFLAALGGVLAREIIAGRNQRNAKILVLIGLLLAGNIIFHVEAAESGAAAYGYGTRLGIGGVIFLIMLIGGRIIPNFTRNWLAKRHAGRLPLPFGRFDILVMVVSAFALLSWIAAPYSAISAWVCLGAGLLNLIRLTRWAGERTLAEPLVAILHTGYLFVPLGFFGVSAAIFFPAVLTHADALHAWTAGAMGIMTIAVMSRAALGHTGQPLTASGGLTAVYGLLIAATLARLSMTISGAPQFLLYLSALCWTGGFLGFVFLFFPLLTRRQP